MAENKIATSTYTYVGVHIADSDDVGEFWNITCPCGVNVKYPVNELPTKDTPMPCGNPDHWAVKYGVVDGG